MLTTDPPAPPAPAPSPEPAGEQGTERHCANCASLLAPGQEWCTECGQGAPDSLDRTPGWRSAGALVALAVVLAVAAVSTGYAALRQSHSQPPAPTTTVVAQVTRQATTTTLGSPAAGASGATGAAGAVTPATSVTSTSTSTSVAVTAPPSTASVTTTASALTPSVTTPAPPTIPAPTPTPTLSTAVTTPVVPLTTTTTTASGVPATTTPVSTTPPTTTPVTPTTATSTTTTTSSSTTSSAHGRSPGTALTLDPDAATIYNPYNYPSSRFSDPSLATDGDPTTGWTAKPAPTSGPRMAVGLLIDLNHPLRLRTIKLVTTTPGMIIELYGANGSKPPATITTPGWHHLYAPRKVTTHETFPINIRTHFRWVLFWITYTGQTSTTAPAVIDEATLYAPEPPAG